MKLQTVSDRCTQLLVQIDAFRAFLKLLRLILQHRLFWTWTADQSNLCTPAGMLLREAQTRILSRKRQETPGSGWNGAPAVAIVAQLTAASLSLLWNPLCWKGWMSWAAWTTTFCSWPEGNCSVEGQPIMQRPVSCWP